MQNGQAGSGDGDHGALENHEGDLLVCQAAVESTGQLGNTEDGSDEDAERGDAETEQEKVEEAALLEAGKLLRPRVAVLVQTPCEFCTEHAKESQGEDLEPQTRDHDIDTGVDLALGVCSRCKATTKSLEDQGEDITSAEDDCVRARSEAREVLTVDADDAGQAEVDSSREEGGSNGEADEIDEEVVTGGIEDIAPE